MYSGKDKNTFLDFNVYKQHIDSFNDLFELQLEGGEPLLNKDLYLFIHYALYTKRCKKIIISTNGILIDNVLDNLINICKDNNIEIVIKQSINYWLLNHNPNLLKKCRDLYLATEFIDNFKVIFNVRVRKNDNFIIEELEKSKIKDYCNIFELQSYGKFSNKTEYSKPFICQNIDDWFIYASDGKCFNKDLIARSEYEKTLY